MKTLLPFRSLRLRLLGPLTLTALVAAVFVAAISYRLGSRRADQELATRFDAIAASLSNSKFPLNPTVLELLAELTQTELVALNQNGQREHSTIPLDDEFDLHVETRPDRRPAGDQVQVPLSLHSGVQGFRVYMFATKGGANRSDRVAEVAVLFNETQIAASRRRAAILPLATGLSVIVALSSVTLILTSRLVSRISKLKRKVDLVAGGDFGSTVSDRVGDEIGRLGQAVDSMGGQLDGLWKQVNRQQSEKLLHQVAGGMAHQLRNSLTGARMAVELHATECSNSHDEGLRVAISQLEVSEDHVRRLLLVASGRQDEDRPASVLACFADIRSSLSPIARHLRIDVQWEVIGCLQQVLVADGATWVAAVTNLIQNAMQADDRIGVTLGLENEKVALLQVVDNGPGVPESVASEIFEPFVTSKPEGLGLGLPLVKRAATHLGGEVLWRRERDQTIFEFKAACVLAGKQA